MVLPDPLSQQDKKKGTVETHVGTIPLELLERGQKWK